MKLEFKKGSKYSRKDIGWVCFPDEGRPAGGDWDTGYVRVEDNLIIFMNIGVPGTTEHDFDNHYDHSKGVIVWYGKPKSHSNQPTFQKLLSGEMTPHFFARWDNKDPQFSYLGVGNVVSFKDGHPCLDGNKNEVETIELKLTVEDSGEIIPIQNQTNVDENKDISLETNFTPKSSFLLEKHLEDYIIKNWSNIELNKNYDIHIENNKVMGQIQRYMGHIKNNLAGDKDVKGLIIALEDDKNLRDALSVAPNIKFMKYEVSFKLVE